jgi:large subunit ribosomal protein L13
MCAQIAQVIQGKNSPHYKPYKIEFLDKCIIVNAKHAFLTGKKLEQKLYRHHTGFPGGLKEIKAKHYLEKNPSEMITRSIKGMLPKNKMRKLFLTKVQIFDEGMHNLQNKGLPQFGKTTPIDYNDVFGTKPVSKEDTVIVSTNVPDKDFPEEMKDIPKEINPYINKPAYMNESDFKINKKMAEKYAKYTKRQIFKQYKRIRNMSYRYI